MIGGRVDGDESELYVTPFCGYRVWLMTEGLELTAVVHPQCVYSCDEDNAAECLNRHLAGEPHLAPAATCQCGYWAFSSYEKLGGFQVWGGDRFVRAVRGLCLGWGRMVLCEHGWRAQYVRPVALLHWPGRAHQPRTPDADPSDALMWNERAEQISERHRIPYVSDVASLEAVAHDFAACDA